MKKLIILAGPSAVGKTTLAKYMTEKNTELECSRSATTRTPRGDSHDGEYLYYSVDDFISSARAGQMLEYTEYAGSLYGTPKSEIERIEKERKIPVLVLDKEGMESIKTAGEYPSFAVYLYDDPNVLEGRLYARYLKDAPSASGLSKFCERKERNLHELASIEDFAPGFDFIVRNDDIEKCAEKILSAYKSEETLDNTAAIAEVNELFEAKFR